MYNVKNNVKNQSVMKIVCLIVSAILVFLQAIQTRVSLYKINFTLVN